MNALVLPYPSVKLARMHAGKRARRPALVFLITSLFWAAAPDAAEEQDGVATMLRSGAPDLALRLLERYQPPPDQAEQWMLWERQRFAIYTERRDWDAIQRRADTLPEGLPVNFQRWVLTEAAKARLSANDPPGARKILRNLLWDADTGAGQAAEWRRLVIRSYLMEDNTVDAHAAVLRYVQDFKASNDAWLLLHAEVLLQANQSRAAFDILGGIQSFEGRFLKLLAGMRAGQYPLPNVITDGRTLVSETRNHPEMQRAAWALVAEAAAEARDGVQRITALEGYFSLDTRAVSEKYLIRLKPEDLWRAYDTLAVHVGSASRLHIGEDDAWLERAETLAQHEGERGRQEEITGRTYARAIHAFLAAHARDPGVRAQAHELFVEGLLKEGNGRVARVLYADSGRFRLPGDIPATVRYRLVDQALQDYDIKFAAALIKDLDKPPAKDDTHLWALRRARVLVYAGDYRPALIALSGILDEKPRLDEAFADRYIQVMFDLQAAGRHVEVLVLLESLMRQVDNNRLRRELLFWMADSHAALGRYAEAAELYLRSAGYVGASEGDIWGQTARFHAAGALGKAGLTADARRVYSKLLGQTSDPRQRIIIERDLQQLWLLEKNPTTP